HMTRMFAFLIAALFALAVGGYAQAQGFGWNQGRGLDFNQGYDPGFGQGFDRGFGSPDVMRGGPDYYATGSSPIPRTLVRIDTGYAPGPLFGSTAEDRLYLGWGEG